MFPLSSFPGNLNLQMSYIIDKIKIYIIRMKSVHTVSLYMEFGIGEESTLSYGLGQRLCQGFYPRLNPTICFQSRTWSTFMVSAEGPWKGNTDVTRAIEQKFAVVLPVPITITLLYWHSADVRGKGIDQRYVYIKVLPCYTDNQLYMYLYQTIPVQDRNSLSTMRL